MTTGIFQLFPRK